MTTLEVGADETMRTHSYLSVPWISIDVYSEVLLLRHTKSHSVI